MFRMSLFALVLSASPALADRFLAEATCEPSEAEMVFDCKIALTEGGRPVEDAVFTVKADMPTMPMAHNMPPADATAAGQPGIYSVQLELQMPGDWNLTLDVSLPRRDRVVVPYTFGALPQE